jgi:hypothetical protein
MTASKTATVETLTAEVRVLMVGSRQVTLSVYGQLDWAEYEDMEAFGRVNPRGAEYGYIYFVGRHRENGSLVRGSIPASKSAIQGENRDLWRAIGDCGSKGERLSEFIKQHHDGRSYRCSKEDHSQCEISVYDSAGGKWKRRQIDEVQTDVQRLRDQAAELQRIGDQEIAEALALAATAAALPLIVLAGLR